MGLWDVVKVLLLELQPARAVELIGAPPRAIRVIAVGERAEIAQGVLAEIERCVGVALKVA